LTKKLQFYF